MTEMTRRSLTGLLMGGAAGLLTPSLAAAGQSAAEPRGWRAAFNTPPARLDAALRPLSGRLPDGLRGVLFRNGPAQFERNGERLGHWFDGDGMVQRFEFTDAGVRHRGRFVQTDKRRDEEAAGRFLYAGFGFTPNNPRGSARPDAINAANTSILPFGDEIWALWEGGSPWRVDAETLDTLGRQAFEGGADGLPFSAHPKRDRDGTIWNFGGFGRRAVIWRLDRNGALERIQLLELPAAGLMHDFAITERFILLIIPPLILEGPVANNLVDAFQWRPDEPLRIAVIDKATLTVQSVREAPARFLFHVGNAYEEADGTIRFDAFLTRTAQFATGAARALPQGRYVDEPGARPCLITLPPSGGVAIDVHDGEGEFPQIDPRLATRPHTRLYGMTGTGVGCWDWRSGAVRRFDYEPDYWAEEPLFIPRSPSDPGGWLVTTAFNGAAERTELHVFQAEALDDGPVASFACPYALPLGFHGAFVRA
jgi:carotenoid cleavage dioxygenase-like enzyme